MREESNTKRQLCEQAIQHDELVQSFEFDCNTKETQTDMVFEEKSVTKIDVGVQCNIEIQEPFHIPLTSSGTGESDNQSSDEFSESEDESPIDPSEKPSKAAFIVYWTSLLILLERCLFPACVLSSAVTSIIYKGSQLIVTMKCQGGHTMTWNSQPNCNHYSVGNLVGAASVLFSANTYQRIASFFELANIQWLSKTSYYAIQKKYLTGVVNKTFIEKSAEMFNDIKMRGIYSLSGDGRCDSPGHNAKYLTYSFLDRVTNKVIAFSLVQVTEAGNSNRMEKMGFTKTLNHLKNNGIIPTQITTDRHSQIRKYMREEEPEIEHQFDIWHFAKNIKQRLIAASKKTSCKIIEKWIRSIGNHLWWACATCEGDSELLREKWISVLFHIQNKHKWTGCKKFIKCQHPRLTKKQIKAKEWISPKSEAFEALQKIVLDAKVLKDLNYLNKFCHTGVLEVYHSLYNKWAPKRQHFSYQGMLARSQLAIMDFNQGSNLEQAKTRKGEDKYKVQFSKITKTWSSKPVKKQKDRTFLQDMVKETVKFATEKKYPEKPATPSLPSNIASTPKPNKVDVIKNQLSRFGNKK